MTNMKKLNLNKYFLISFCVGIFVIAVMAINESGFTEVAENNTTIAAQAYVPLTDGLPVDITEQANESTGNLLGLFFRWGISIAVILSIIMIMYGGLQYMTTDAYSGKAEGKEKVTGAIIGLILALSSFLILQTINPDIVDFDSNSFINPNNLLNR
jgi:hypothetical protein